MEVSLFCIGLDSVMLICMRCSVNQVLLEKNMAYFLQYNMMYHHFLLVSIKIISKNFVEQNINIETFEIK